MMIYGKNNEYHFEINISDYKVGDTIILKTYDDGANLQIKYQYKDDYKSNKLICLEEYYGLNYIPIRKTKNDSSLILYIKYKGTSNLLSILNIVKIEVIEINSDYDETFKGPKLLFFDYFKFNGFNSFGIESNINFIFYEQKMGFSMSMGDNSYKNFLIYRQNEEESLMLKRGFFYLNSTDNYHIVIKKFNFSIIERSFGRFLIKGHEYLSLCQGEEPKTEFYYYRKFSSYSSGLIEFFTPVFGNFDSFLIDEQDIKTLSDFNFNNPNKTYEYSPIYLTAYIKIACKEPALIKHSFLDSLYMNPSNLTSGKSHIFTLSYLNSKSIHLPDELKGKNVSLKFSILENHNNYQIQLNLNGTKHILGNMSLEFEFEYTYQETGSYIIDLNKGDIKDIIYIEIVVGNKDIFKEFEIINLNDAFGNLNLGGKRSGIIKVPKQDDDNYYNFSIIQNRISYEYNFYIDIYYDKFEFIPIHDRDELIYEYSNIIPFSVNPYSYIPNNHEKSDEKYFYIFVYGYGENLLIKRPKLLTDINYKQINTFPKLNEEDKQYYYKIPFSSKDYDSLSIQTNNNPNITFSLSKGNNFYLFNPKYDFNFYNIPKDIFNKNIYLNYYGNSYSDGYINFIPGHEFPLYQYIESFPFNLTIKQKEKENKLIINLRSYSYYIKRPIIYHLIFNVLKNDEIIFSVLTENRNFDKKQMMSKVEDNGENEYFQTELPINIELNDYELDHDSNYMIFVPVDKETKFVFKYSYRDIYFDYKNIKSNTILLIIIIVIAVLLVAIIIIGILYYRKKKKEKGNNIEDLMDSNEKILSDN